MGCRFSITYLYSNVSKYSLPGFGMRCWGTHAVASTSVRTGADWSTAPYTETPSLLAIQFAKTFAAFGCGAWFHSDTMPYPPASAVGRSGSTNSCTGTAPSYWFMYTGVIA